MTMLIIFVYVLPAVVFFVLNCWDTIDCKGQITLADIMSGLLPAIIPVINLAALFTISNDLINKHNLINWDFVIYRRKK